MPKLILILFCALTIQAVAAEPRLTPGEEKLKDALDKCLSRVCSGQSDDAFTFLFKEFWKDRSTISQATVSMQRQYRNIAGRAEDALGPNVPDGYELVGIKRLGSSVVKFVYLQKNEFAFLPWSFTFYRPNQDWRLSHISFPDLTSDDIKDLTVAVQLGETR